MTSFARIVNTTEVYDADDLLPVLKEEGRVRIFAPKEEVPALRREVRRRLEGLGAIISVGRETEDGRKPLVVVLKNVD